MSKTSYDRNEGNGELYYLEIYEDFRRIFGDLNFLSKWSQSDWVEYNKNAVSSAIY